MAFNRPDSLFGLLTKSKFSYEDITNYKDLITKQFCVRLEDLLEKFNKLKNTNSKILADLRR